MTTRRFYHTELRRYVTAHIADAGAKPPPEQPITVAAIVPKFTEPPEPAEPPKRVRRPRAETLQLIIDAARQEPGSCYELAARTGLALATVQQHINRNRRRVFVQVGSVQVKGQIVRRIWGVVP